MKVKSHDDIITHGQLNQITSIRSRFDLVFNDVDTLFRSLPKNHKYRPICGDIIDKKWDILGWLDDIIKGKIPLGNTSFSSEELDMIGCEGTDPD